MFSETFRTYIGIFNTTIMGIAFFILGYSLRRMLGERKIRSAEEEASRILREARETASVEISNLKTKIEMELEKEKIRFDKEMAEKHREFNILNKRIIQREENLQKQANLLEKKEREIFNKGKDIEKREKNITDEEKKIQTIIEGQKEQLEKISKLSIEEAKKMLLSRLIDEVKYDAGKKIMEIEEEIRTIADKKAKDIISLAIQKTAPDYVAETTVSVVPLPNDEMKGRIIGREGRNIRTFETESGVTLLVDDTPESIVISSFDAMRREIARISLEKLIADGRIHPTRIEEVIKKSREELNKSVHEEGQKISFEMEVHNLHPELINLLGKLKYRTSYGQNVLQHSIEVAHLAFSLAAELKVDAKLARRAGLIHDIGKAIDRDVEGTHAQIGADLAKKFGESEKIIHIIASHHEEIETKLIEAVLVQAADALSSARPGARQETLETYIRRIEKLEQLANEFPGVIKSYAIQAGREIRIMVEPEKIKDENTIILAKDIAKKVEKELEYPGQIKVTVIRELRATEVAK